MRRDPPSASPPLRAFGAHSAAPKVSWVRTKVSCMSSRVHGQLHCYTPRNSHSFTKAPRAAASLCVIMCASLAVLLNTSPKYLNSCTHVNCQLPQLTISALSSRTTITCVLVRLILRWLLLQNVLKDSNKCLNPSNVRARSTTSSAKSKITNCNVSSFTKAPYCRPYTIFVTFSTASSTLSKYKLNNNGEHGHPYFNPTLIGMLLVPGASAICAVRCSYRRYSPATSGTGRCSSSSRTPHNFPLSILSYAFSKSTNIT